MKHAAGALLPPLDSPLARRGPRRLEIERRVRQAILDGALRSGARLPSTRTMARELAVSRTTAEEAFGQLVAEGYLTRRVGDGTYVSAAVSERFRPRTRPSSGTRLRADEALSARGRAIASAASCLDPELVVPFRAGHPDYDAFPLPLWNRLLSRRARQSGRALLGYGDPAGLAPLRVALAEHLATSRGVRCDPARVVVISSSQQALDLAARLLLDPGDAAWIEEPGYPGARGALAAAGARLVPVPVDAAGLNVAEGRRLAPDARLACDQDALARTQYPLGATMSLERRWRGAARVGERFRRVDRGGRL